MEEWLKSNLNNLMVDHTDHQLIIRESHSEAREASQATPKKKPEKRDSDVTTELEKKKKDYEKEERDVNGNFDIL